MKRYILTIVLMSMLVPTMALCEEFGEPEHIEWQTEQRGRELELQHREEKMAIEREREKLEFEQRMTELEREREEHEDGALPLLLLIAVVHILVAVWVYTDIRKLNRGSGIWIVIALLTGLLGTLVYAVVRMGDARIEKS
jgi:H+/Cl- antiporter ClcA